MIDFPASPTVGQTFTTAGVTWTWDGVKWGVGTPPPIYVPLAGGTMTGDLILNRDPVIALGAATKQYADTHIIGDNRLINGDMRIDQRNNGASGTANAFTVDRWSYYGSLASKFTWGRNLNAVGGPVGFPYYLGVQSSSAYTSVAADNFEIYHPIEADMVGDFAWGTSNAQPVTLSFWARSSLTGTFGAALTNYSPTTRSYPFSFSLPTANAWTKIVVNIPGDTAGTWVMQGNAGSIYLQFDLGTGSNWRGTAGAWVSANLIGVTGAVSVVGTNGASFYLTGVKLEIGSVATPFVRQTLAKSQADCERYFRWISHNVEFYATAANQYSVMPIVLSPAMRITPVFSANTADPNASPSAVNQTANTPQPTAPYGGYTNLTAGAAGPCQLLGYRFSATAEL